MGSIVDAGNLKFWENYPKVVLKRNIITVNCVVIVGPPYCIYKVTPVTSALLKNNATHGFRRYFGIT